MAVALLLTGAAGAQTVAPVAAPPASGAAPPTPNSGGAGQFPPAVSALPSTGKVAAYTLNDVLRIALQNNSSIVLARQRLRRADQLLPQVDAQARPQITANLTDTYSSYDTFGTSAGGSSSTITLPGGGSIPVITDQGGGSSTGFVGGGGGGNAASNGQAATSTTTGTGTTGTGTTGTGTGTTGTTGTGSGTTGTGSGGTGTSGTGTSSNGSAGGTAQMAAVPAIVNQLAAATGGTTSAATRTAAVTRRPADASNPGTGTTTTGTTFNTGSGGKRNNYAGRLTVTQYVDLFRLVPAARDVEKATRDFYATDLDRVANETALTVKKQFFQVLRDQESVSTQIEQVRYATENVRIAQARFTAGAAAQFDVVTAQTTLINNQQALSSAQNTLRLDSANLNNLLGLPQGNVTSLQTPALPALNQTFDAGREVKTALARRPEVRQATGNINIARKLVTLAGATLKPSLGFSAAAGYTGTRTGTTPQDTYSLSALVAIPLSDGGSTQARVRSAQVDLDTQQVTLSQLQQSVELEVRQALSNVFDAQVRAGSAQQGVAQAQESVRLAQVRYQNGIGTFLEVTNAQAQLATARNNLSTAQFDYQTSLAQLARAEGGR